MALSKPALAGTYVAMVTPFTDDDHLDIEGLRELIDWWIDQGVHGLIPSGSTGEFLQLSADERRELIHRTCEFAAGRVPVVAGASADSTAEAVRWTEEAERAGATGVMVVAPYYSRPTDDELVAHYHAVASRTSLNVMAYNNPETTGIDMQPRLLARICEETGIGYVKESTRDVRRVEDILRLTDGRMQVFAGILAHESFLVGATGWVSVPANVVPRLAAEMYIAACERSDAHRSATINQLIWELMALEDDTGKYVQIPKAALGLMGRPGGNPRLPRLPLTVDEMARLTRICNDLGLAATSQPSA